MKIGDLARQSPLLVQSLAAIILFMPVLVLGENFSHSDRFNHVWVVQFSEQFLTGDLYPRWLYRSFDNLGSPSFYYYPPAFYFVAALVHAASLGTLSAVHQIPVAALIISVASGGAMYALLREHVSAGWATVGGIAYQLAPYHLTDFYIRGALGEYAAFLFLPLVVLGMKRLAVSPQKGQILLPISFAGLIYSHLPTTVLLSCALVPYGLVLTLVHYKNTRDRVYYLAKLAGSIILALALSAAYIVPALVLLPYMATSEQWTSFHVPSVWFLSNIRNWPLRSFNMSMDGLALAMGTTALIILWKIWRTEPRPFEIIFWSVVTTLSGLLIFGFVPWFWSFPPLAMVQFPFRLLAVTELAFVFSAILYLDRAGFRPRQLGWLAAPAAVAALAATPLAYSGIAQLSALPAKSLAVHSWWESDFRDADPYVPPNFYSSRAPGATYAGDRDSLDGRYSAFATKRLGQLYRLPVAYVTSGSIAASDMRAHQFSVSVLTERPAVVSLRKLYFPSWRVTSAGGQTVHSFPDPATGLLDFSVPAGKSRYYVAQANPPIVEYSIAASLTALLFLLFRFALGFSKARQPRA